MQTHRTRTAALACAFTFLSCSKPAPERLPDAGAADAGPMQLPALGVLSDASMPPQEDFVSSALKSPKIVLFGDSIVHYSDELVSRRLGQVLVSGDAGPGASVLGVTKGGERVTGWIGKQFDKYVGDPDFNIVVLQGGVNDIGWYGKTGRTRARREAYEKLVEKFSGMVDAALENRKIIVLVTVSPWKGQPHWNEAGQEDSERLNAWMKSQASRHGVFVADTYAALVTANPRCERERDTLEPGYRGGDMQHTNDAGRKVIGETVAKALGFAVPSPTLPEKNRPFEQCPR
ncbi:MAG TPA: SGNH/GDSL hydrolase family protein [Candidatus Bilamarchaeum sp.]|nr:SGNH/GDSL hydrolase family protein [Candidatus Bilamarchaeum sp.]